MILEKINEHKEVTDHLKSKLDGVHREKEAIKKQNYFTMALQMHLKKMVANKLEKEKQELIANHEDHKTKLKKQHNEDKQLQEEEHEKQLKKQEIEYSAKVAHSRNSKKDAEDKMKEVEVENEQKVEEL